MDLGFGDHIQEVGQATAHALLRGAEVQEQTLESELAKYDRLLEDEVSESAALGKVMKTAPSVFASESPRW